MHSEIGPDAHVGLTTPARLGAAIRSIRKHKRLTQKQLADHAGVSLFCLRDLERADRSVGAENVFKVLAVLRCSISLLPYEGWVTEDGGPHSTQTS